MRQPAPSDAPSARPHEEPRPKQAVVSLGSAGRRILDTRRHRQLGGSVPTLEHNGLIEMFRENPPLAPHFLALLFHLDVPPHASVRVADSSLDQLIPVEFRADLVLELRDAQGRLVFAIVFEAQREAKPRKKYTWPVYLVVARAERECPTVVLVLAIDAEVAAWAAEKIDLGAGRGVIEPFVLGPATVPVVTDLGLAEKEVELAIPSAMAHGKREALLRLLARAGIALDEDDRVRIENCTDAATLDRWVDNVLGAKTARDVLS